MHSDPIFLFDIDGTLMRGAGLEHRSALVEAIRRYSGHLTTVDGIPVHGMLDRDILAEMMRRAGCDQETIDSSLAPVMSLAQEIYPGTCPDLRSKLLPGVVETLASLAENGHRLGLVTGNLTSIGWTKVRRAGIGHHFSFGAFADMGRTRTELARLAWQMTGGSDPQSVTLIGDSPSDVQAAKANGFRMVAVATGLTPRSNLEALGADLVLNDLSTIDARTQLRGRTDAK